MVEPEHPGKDERMAGDLNNTSETKKDDAHENQQAQVMDTITQVEKIKEVIDLEAGDDQEEDSSNAVVETAIITE